MTIINNKFMHIHIYIYIYREREKEMYLCIYVDLCLFVYFARGRVRRRPLGQAAEVPGVQVLVGQREA